MSVIIRLQNLPWSANALDIRQYFRGLSIPEGGVHIVGGELGDAFIAFSTDEDARQAFNMNGGKIKEVQIKLLLSSRTEMQKVIEAARNSTPFMQVAAPPPQPLTIPSTQIIPPIKSLESPDQIKSGVDSKSKSESKSSDKKRGRSRSRSKERRDRRDRSRDRKDRRRRDRSRSRDRRDRRRDRRDRSRSRDRSRTHDRSRSRDRDSTRKSRDKKRETSYDDKQNGDGSPANNVTDLIDLTNESKPPTPWGDNVKPTIINPNFNQSGLLGNAPIINTALEQARRSLGSLNAIRNQEQDISPFNGGLRPRDSWPPGQQLNVDNRFADKMPNLNANDNASNPVGVPPLMGIRPNLDRAFMTQNNAVPAFNRNNFENVRSQMNTGIGRSLLGRPSLLGRGGPISPFDQRDNTPELHGSSDHSSEGMYREPRPKVPRPGCCVKVYIGRGGYGDVRRFFQGLFIANDGVKLINDKEGRRTGVAYVRFVRPDGKSEALKRSGQYNRGQPVDVAHLDDDEFDEAVDSFRPYDDNSDSEKSSSGREKPPFTDKIKNNIHDIDPKMCCLSILNLPPFTKEHDIIQMIGEHPLVSILMVMNRDNRQMAFIQFHKAEDAHKVGNMTDKHVISGKKVTVRLISETVFAEVKRQHNSGGLIDVPEEDQTQQKKTGGGGGDNAQPGNGFQRELLSDCIILKGLPYKTSDRDIIDFFSDVGLLPTRIHVPQGKFNKLTDCFCEFASSDEAQRALIKNGFPLGMGMSAVTVEMIPRPEMEKILGVGQPMQMEPRHGGNFHPNRHHSGGGAPMQSLLGPGPRMMQTNPQGTSDAIPEAFNNPGCVLALENVPFRANVDEILAFFQGFDIREENVLRRYNEKGHATGDARVAFASPTEAQRALSELRHCKIRDRTIFMRLLQ